MDGELPLGYPVNPSEPLCVLKARLQRRRFGMKFVKEKRPSYARQDPSLAFSLAARIRGDGASHVGEMLSMASE